MPRPSKYLLRQALFLVPATPTLTCGTLIPPLVVRCIRHRPSRMCWYIEIGPIWSRRVPVRLWKELGLEKWWPAILIRCSRWLTPHKRTSRIPFTITDMPSLSRSCWKATWPGRTFPYQWNFNVEVRFWKRRRRLIRRHLRAKKRIHLVKSFARTCKLFSQTSIVGYEAFHLLSDVLFCFVHRQVGCMRCEACYLCC